MTLLSALTGPLPKSSSMPPSPCWRICPSQHRIRRCTAHLSNSSGGHHRIMGSARLYYRPDACVTLHDYHTNLCRLQLLLALFPLTARLSEASCSAAPPTKPSPVKSGPVDMCIQNKTPIRARDIENIRYLVALLIISDGFVLS